MTLFDTVKTNLVKYRMNPVLVVPPLVAMIFSLITSLMLVPPPTLEVFAPELLTFIFVVFGILLLNLVIYLIALLGQASMAGKVVVEGKTRLIDWAKGIKKYFLRVLGIGLIYFGIIIVFFMLIGIIVALAMLPQIISQMDKAPPPTPQISPLTSMVTSGVTVLLMTIASAVFYIWLAPAVIDDKGVFASLDMGTKTMRKGGKAFLGFIALFFTVSVIAELIRTFPTYLGVTIQPICYNGCVTPTQVVSQAIMTIFSPLWFLIAFTIYSEQKLLDTTS